MYYLQVKLKQLDVVNQQEKAKKLLKWLSKR